jgi:hypothetical protein
MIEPDDAHNRTMKNSECTIYITTKHGWTQKYRKEKNGWTQTTRNGVVRMLSAEQLLVLD